MPVSRAEADQIIANAKAQGQSMKMTCALDMADVLKPVPPFQDVPVSFFPEALRADFAAWPGVEDRYITESDMGKNREWERAAAPGRDRRPSEDAPMHDPARSTAGRTGRRMSTILLGLAETAEGERVSLGDMVDAFDARAYGPLIVLFAAPNVLPVALPGISAVLGAPLILLTAQLMLGLHRPWLPGFLRRRSLSAHELRVARPPHRAAARPHRGDDPAAAPAAHQRLGHSG